MKIAFVWTEFSGYMASCWKALAARSDVELRVWVEVRKKGDVAFDPKPLMGNVSYSWLYTEDITASEQLRVADEIATFAPDVLFICGWARPLPPFVAKYERLKDIPKVLCCDMPWEWKFRKFAARFVLWRHLRRFKKIMVPGRRAAMYARWLGFRNEDIQLGEYGIDVERFRGAVESLESRVARRGFLYVGRLSPEKGIKILAEAYRKYRAAGGDWSLDVYGKGAEVHWLEGIEGVTLHGFTQPHEVPQIFAQADAFILASLWDPWPLVVLESCAAELPIICTENCWNRYELIRENGVVVPVEDSTAMAQAMLRVGELKGTIGCERAADYSCERWVERVIDVTRELCS